MPDFYDIDRANERLPELRETLSTLRTLRLELMELRDRLVALRAAAKLSDEGDGGYGEQQSRRLDLRMRGVVDQMVAAAAQIDHWGIQLRDVDSGLVDFPALVSGRQVWLCWRLGEDRVEWWHELEAGVAGRRRLEDLT